MPRSEWLVVRAQADPPLADALPPVQVIGSRMNGLKDGISDEWFATFDLDSPARKRGQVSSVVIDRPILQQILLDKVRAHSDGT